MNSFFKRSFFFVCSLLVLFPLLCLGGDFAGGEGTSDQPYVIETPEQLATLANYCGPEYRGTYFILGGDIDLSGISSWAPIGRYLSEDDFSGAFQGTLDGRGHTVRGLKHVSDTEVNSGLFACLNEAVILDLSIEGAEVTQTKKDISCAGILAAHIRATRLNYCSVKGAVSSSFEAGGLVGRDHGLSRWEYCRAEVSVAAIFYGGGMLGRSEQGSVFFQCHTAGSVSVSYDLAYSNAYESFGGGFLAAVIEKDGAARSEFQECSSSVALSCRHGDQSFFLGGFAGLLVSSDVKDCLASGVVQTTASSVSLLGGFCADSLLSHYTNCAAKGAVSATAGLDQAMAGGFVARNDQGNYKNCYAKGAVSATLINTLVGEATTGGFIAFNNNGGRLENCYAEGTVTNQCDQASQSFSGGICGYDTKGAYKGCLALGSLISRTSSAATSLYLGGICGYVNESLLEQNGFSASASVATATESVQFSYSAQNKNGQRVGQLEALSTWTERGFAFGLSSSSPWQPLDDILPPVLYFEKSLTEDQQFVVSPGTLSFGKNDDLSAQVTVKTAANWTASTSETGVLLTPPSGTKEDGGFVLSLEKNTSPLLRQGTVTVLSSGRIRTLSFTQESSVTSFEEWQTEHHLSSRPEHSSSGDGLSDFEKYVMGLDPTLKHADVATVQLEGDVFSVEYPYNPLTSGVEFVGECLKDVDHPEEGWTTEKVRVERTQTHIKVISEWPVSAHRSQLLRLRFSLKPSVPVLP